MLRGNLSTRPFYNERLALVAIGLVALSVLLLTSFNVTQLVRLSAERRAFLARIDRDQTEATRIRQQATTQQQGVDRTVLSKLAASTREANDLIDQRTFSWTAVFRLLEKTLPFDVRLIMVSPRVEKGEFKVAMTVVARSFADVATFIDALGGTGAFYDVAAIDQQRKDDGTYTAAIEASVLVAGTDGACSGARASGGDATMSLWRRIFEERKRVLLPLGIALVANIAVLMLAVLPLQTAVASADARAVGAMRELGDARRLDRQVTQARTGKVRADEELHKFYTEVLPRDFPTAQTTTNLWLTQAAEDAGLSFKGSHFDWDAIRDSALSRAFSRVTLEGRYPNIRRFLYDVEKAKEFIVVEKVELAEQGDQPAANGLLEVSLVVATYFQTKHQP